MERQLRLGQPKLGRELTDTALATAQSLNHLDANRICQGLEQLAGLASRQAMMPTAALACCMAGLAVETMGNTPISGDSLRNSLEEVLSV